MEEDRAQPKRRTHSLSSLNFSGPILLQDLLDIIGCEEQEEHRQLGRTREGSGGYSWPSTWAGPCGAHCGMFSAQLRDLGLQQSVKENLGVAQPAGKLRIRAAQPAKKKEGDFIRVTHLLRASRFGKEDSSRQKLKTET
ncbi:hypothetical protein Droror1_Dr00005040 [Drosera rotundifolia]